MQIDTNTIKSGGKSIKTIENIQNLEVIKSVRISDRKLLLLHSPAVFFMHFLQFSDVYWGCTCTCLSVPGITMPP